LKLEKLQIFLKAVCGGSSEEVQKMEVEGFYPRDELDEIGVPKCVDPKDIQMYLRKDMWTGGPISQKLRDM